MKNFILQVILLMVVFELGHSMRTHTKHRHRLNARHKIRNEIEVRDDDLCPEENGCIFFKKTQRDHAFTRRR